MYETTNQARQIVAEMLQLLIVNFGNYIVVNGF